VLECTGLAGCARGACPVGTRARFQSIAITARHTTKVGNTRSRWPNHLEGAVEGGIRDWGEVVSQLRPLLVTAGDKLGYVLETPQVSRATSRASDGDNAPGEADNQQGSRMPELSSGLLTPQRLHAELLGSTL
jgi:hypothetical protein